MRGETGQDTTAPSPALRWGSVWDTRDVEAREAFDYYREGICESFMELRPEAAAVRRARFSARVESMPIGSGAVNRVHATSHLVMRTAREIARSPGECFYLNLQSGGECHIAQSGREITLRAGDVGIFDSGRPFTLEHPRLPTLAVASFWVPKQALLSRLGGMGPDGPRVLSLHPGLGRLVVETTRAANDGAAGLPADQAARLFEILLDVTAMALSPATASEALPGRGRRAALQLALRRFVERNAADPGLDASRCARAFDISVRYVHRLFELEGTTLGAYLLDVRLANAAAALLAPASAHLPVTTIALDHGFGDLSHFGRAFKARYGVPPGEWRRRGH